MHTTFDKIEPDGKISMEFYNGFRVHLIITEIGEIINNKITKSRVYDRKVVYDLI